MTYYLLGKWIFMGQQERKSKIWEASFKKLLESLTKNLEEGFLA